MSRLNPYSVVLKRAAILRAQRVAAGKTTKVNFFAFHLKLYYYFMKKFERDVLFVGPCF